MDVASAQMWLGTAYATGHGVPANHLQAVAFWRAAAENPMGFDEVKAVAQGFLGDTYYGGQGGIPKDFVMALKWYRLAAERGYPDAQYRLGSMYMRGNAVPKDYQVGTQWYRKAAEQGHAEAQASLGACYFDGSGVNKDYLEAYRWLNLAATSEHQMLRKCVTLWRPNSPLCR